MCEARMVAFQAVREASQGQSHHLGRSAPPVDPVFMMGLLWPFKEMGGRKYKGSTPLGPAIRAPGHNDGQQWTGSKIPKGAGLSAWLHPKRGRMTTDVTNKNPIF